MDRLMAHSMKAYQSKFAGVIQETLALLFPIMLLGSFAEVLKYSFFNAEWFCGDNLWDYQMAARRQTNFATVGTDCSLYS